MVSYVVRRLAIVPVLLFLVSLVSFGLLYLVPGDPAITLAGTAATAKELAEIRQSLGLDRPFWEQFLGWVHGVLGGDLGTSLFSSRDVMETIVQAAPPTISLAIVATVYGCLIGVPVGVWAAARAGSRVDRLLTAVSSLGIALPGFWLGMILISVFAIQLGWLPAGGYAPLGEGIGPWLTHITLPALALGLSIAAELARQTRASMIHSLTGDYLLTARAKGVPRLRLLWKHAFKNASLPIVTLLGMQVTRVVGLGSVVEIVFNLHGIGQLSVNSVGRRDLTMLQGIIFLAAAVIIVVNLLVDLTYARLDPRVRYEAKN